MAVFTFVTDFQLFGNRGSSTTGYNALGGGASGLSVETDFYIEGTTCISKQVKQENKGIEYAYSTLTIFPPTNATTMNIYQWVYTTTKQAMYERTAGGGANSGGLEIDVAGQSGVHTVTVDGRQSQDLDSWHCIVYDPYRSGHTNQLASNDGILSIGALLNNEFSVRGVNFGLDICWVGNYVGGYGGGGTDPDVSFEVISAVTDDPSNRYGAFQRSGSSYQLLGILNIGEPGQTTLFSDVGSSVVIPLRNYPELVGASNNNNTIDRIVGVDCSQVVVQGGSGTTASFTRTIFSSLDPQNTGRFSTTASSTVTLTNAVFSQWGTVTPGGSGTSFSKCKFIDLEVGVVNTAGGTFDSCSFTDCPPAVSSLGSITNCTFSSDGTNGHAIVTDVTSGTVSLTGNSFVGYNVSDGQLDSAIHFTATSGSVTVSLTGGVQPSYRTNGISVTFQSSSTLTLTGLINGSEIRVYQNGTTTEVAGIESTSSSTFATAVNVSAVDIVIHNLGYIHQRIVNVDTSTDRNLPIEYQIDRQYLNP